MSGKGSGRRPAQVNEQAFSDSWDSIFGKKDGAARESLEQINEHLAKAGKPFRIKESINGQPITEPIP